MVTKPHAGGNFTKPDIATLLGQRRCAWGTPRPRQCLFAQTDWAEKEPRFVYDTLPIRIAVHLALDLCCCKQQTASPAGNV